jgi:hypothetical protein
MNARGGCTADAQRARALAAGAGFRVGSAARAGARQNQIETKTWKMFAFSL